MSFRVESKILWRRVTVSSWFRQIKIPDCQPYVNFDINNTRSLLLLNKYPFNLSNVIFVRGCLVLKRYELVPGILETVKMLYLE